jgi:MFS family permease
MLLWALGLFLVGSFICAIASSLMLLVIGRCLQSFGGGGLMTLAQALIGRLYLRKSAAAFKDGSARFSLWQARSVQLPAAS